MNDKKLQILDVGCGKSIAEKVFKDIIDQGYEYDLVRLDINPDNEPDVVHDIRRTFPPELIGRFDLVLASHVLEHVERSLIEATMNNIAETLAHMGEFWLVVPSAEWCAEQIMNGRYDAAIWQCLYGGGEPDMPNHYYHHHGFTLTMMRGMMRKAGLVDRKAYQVPFSISFVRHDTGKEYITEAVANVVIGVKWDEPVAVIGT